MKIINRYLAYVAVLALLFTSCSKDEATTSGDDPGMQSVDLTFGAMLNDLSNRAMEQNKAHFDQVPDCSEEEPAVARIGFSYGGNSYETDVAILSDEDGYFTDYSEELKIPVPNNGSVEVTLESFMVYDGDPDGDGELIWIAPIESEEGQFDGYVDSALPFSFDVQDGTKPYIDVEVLCFDRRVANEYGYVFFDILPEVIYPLCLFVNYCDENGRHYVADYSVDLYFGTDDTGIQLYDYTEESAMAMTGDYGDGAYYADPLCLVVPGPPANLPDDEPYLYLVIHPESWDGTGEIDETPTEGIALSWNMVSDLLNGDGTTNEYLHLLIGECEDAIGRGDGGSGDNDLDDDGVANNVDQCPNTPPNTDVNEVGCPDSDGDGVYDNEDLCENTPPNTDVDEDGCEEGNGGPVACELTIPDAGEGCLRAVVDGQTSSSYAEINFDGGIPLVDANEPLIDVATFGLDLTAGGDIEYNFDAGSATVAQYLIEVSDTEGGDVICVNESDSDNVIEGSFSYPIYVRVTANVCPSE